MIYPAEGEKAVSVLIVAHRHPQSPPWKGGESGALSSSSFIHYPRRSALCRARKQELSEFWKFNSG